MGLFLFEFLVKFFILLGVQTLATQIKVAFRATLVSVFTLIVHVTFWATLRHVQPPRIFSFDRPSLPIYKGFEV